MLFEQYHSHELLTPGINDAGVSQLYTSVPSPDFFLNDYIDAYLPPVQSKTDKYELTNDSHHHHHSQHHEEFLSEFDLEEIIDLAKNSEFDPESLFNDDLEIGEWISQSAFPSPQNVDDVTSCIGDESTTTNDMIVPPSPSISFSSSSPSPSMTRKSKLTPIERKLRKKTQNKTAAEKYRIKKKSERDRLLDRHSLLKSFNKDLKSELENLTFQVQQLKQLLVDVVHPSLPLSQ